MNGRVVADIHVHGSGTMQVRRIAPGNFPPSCTLELWDTDGVQVAIYLPIHMEDAARRMAEIFNENINYPKEKT